MATSPVLRPPYPLSRAVASAMADGVAGPPAPFLIRSGGLGPRVHQFIQALKAAWVLRSN